MLLCTNRLSSRVSNKPQDVTRDPSPGGPFLVPPSLPLLLLLLLLPLLLHLLLLWQPIAAALDSLHK